MIRVKVIPDAPKLSEVVLFSFDQFALPFVSGLKTRLVQGKDPYHMPEVVLNRGAEGSPDSLIAKFYGSIEEVDGEFRMWYSGRDGKNMWICYATSPDGVHWEKPNLGLVEYKGDKHNNIVPAFLDGQSQALVLYDPDENDEARRFKMVAEAMGNHICVAFSADGLQWSEYKGNPVGPKLEMGGLMKYNGCYYTNGQGGWQDTNGREMLTFASYDFTTWSQASCLSLRRGGLTPRGPDLGGWNDHEEIHLGSAVWNRGCVIPAIYGQWHGHPAGDRNFLSMDLGFAVSSDALHFYEPVPDFKMIPAYEEREVRTGIGPALMQGQAFANVGDESYFWYESWNAGGVRLAKWERDRLGYFEPMTQKRLHDTAGLLGAKTAPHFVSCPIEIDAAAKLALNIGGLSQYTTVTAELQDEWFNPIPGFGDRECVAPVESGLRQPVEWKNRKVIEPQPKPVRVKLAFGGIRPEDARFFAAYLSNA